MINKSELTKNRYTPKETANFLGITTRTLFRWGDKNLIKFDETIIDNVVTRRLYPREAVIEALNNRGLLYDDVTQQRQDIIYARVSTHKQKTSGDLERQVNALKLYAIDKNPNNLLTLTDVGSGLNDNRKNLIKLLTLIQEDKVNRVFITYKDRLTRFGFNYLKIIADFHHTEIVIVSSDLINKSLETELAEDIISVIHSFSGKLYGLRKQVKQNIDKALTDE